MDAVQQQITDCLRYLAEDDQSLTGADVLLCNRLADQDSLSAAQMLFGARLVRRYQQELEAAGLVVPEEAAIDAAIEQEKLQAGQLTEQEARQRTPEPEPLPEGAQPAKITYQVYLYHDRSFNEQRVVAEFPYDRAIVAALQPLKESVDGWSFDRYGKKEWSYPAVAVARVVESLAKFPRFSLGPGVAELVAQAQYAEAFATELAALEASVLELEREAAMQVAYPYMQGKPLADGHPLYQHQREAVRTLISQQRVVLAHDLGLGKTRSALIAAKAYGLPILVIAPVGLHINWQREASAADVALADLISWAKIPEPSAEMDYTLIADECFPYDTQIVTDQGLFPIGEIVENALPVSVLSYDVENKTTAWKPITRYVKRSLQGKLVRVIHEDGSFVCTPNHRIWTEDNGYVEAGSLQSGARLRVLSEAIPYFDQREAYRPLLQQIVCKFPQQSAEDTQSQGTQAICEQEVRVVPRPVLVSLNGSIQGYAAPLLQQELCQCSQSQSARGTRAFQTIDQVCTGQDSWQQAPRCFPAYEAAQPHEQLGAFGENAAEVSWQNVSSAWRERRTYCTATHAGPSIEITYRIPHPDCFSERAVPITSDLLQGGYSRSGASNSHRSGWQISSGETLEVSGQAQNRDLAGSRVVRVEVYEPESGDRIGPGGSRDPAVYNLEVLDNHNYIADGVLVSNCHYAQNLDAQRTQAFLKLCEQAHAVFPLTGTPMKNARPINLFPLLVAIRHPLAANRKRYEERYCAGHYRSVGRKNFAWDVSGSSHLDELHQQIKDQVLYKKKEECLDLPPKTRVVRAAEASGAAAKAYEKTLERLRKEHERRMEAKLEARIEELLAELGEEHQEQIDRGALAMELAQDERNAVALVEMAILRHAGSLAKVESAVELAQEALDEDESVVLFSTYRDTADQLAQKLACDVLNGDVPKKERQHMIDQFQARESRALICTYGAGGVGITLTAAQTVILIDRPWTPGDCVQAEDRLHRIGQKDAVTSLWLQYGPLDFRIDALLQQKQERIDQVLRGKRATVGDIPSVRAMAAEIMTSVHYDTPVEELLAAHGLTLPDGSELLETPTLPAAAQPPLQSRAARRRPQDGLRKDGGRDQRVKGSAPRQRLDVKLDPEVAAFLRTLKAENQRAAKEPGYSGFLEELVRSSEKFQRWQLDQ